MKRNYRYFAIAAFALLVAACMKLVNVSHPASAPVNTGVDASFEVEIAIDDGAGSYSTPVVGILAPVAWRLSQGAQVTYTTSDTPGVIHTMHVATASELAGGKTPWPAYLKAGLGSQGNYEPVEWVVYIADTQHTWKDKDAFTGVMNVRFTTGAENIRTNLVYFIGNAKDCIDANHECFLLHKQPFETTGGDNDLIDYTTPKICTVSPETFTWEDIVRFDYDATVQVDDKDSALKGAAAVYFQARAFYDGGQQKVVDVVSAKTLMQKKSADKWFIYIYPHEFFGIPADKQIEKISCYLTNDDKSVEVFQPGMGAEFSFSEKCE